MYHNASIFCVNFIFANFVSPYSIANIRSQTLNNNLWAWFLVGAITVGLMDGLKQHRRWQVKFIFLQHELFQDEYSAVFYSILLRAPAAMTLQSEWWQLAKRTSVNRALEKQASQQKAKRRKVDTHFSRDWPRMGIPPPQSQRKDRKVLELGTKWQNRKGFLYAKYCSIKVLEYILCRQPKKKEYTMYS